MKAKSIHGKSPEEIKTTLQKSMAGGYQPTLAIVFMSVKQDRKAISEVLAQYDIDVFGATSCGEFINGHQSKGEIVVLLMDLPRDSYTIFLEDMGSRSIHEASEHVASSVRTQFANPALIVCSTGVTPSGELFDGTALVHELSEAIGKDKVFFGGMAGDDMTLTGTSVFTQNQVTNHGLAALVLNTDKVSLNGMAITGWKRLGISRKVTQSKGKLL